MLHAALLGALLLAGSASAAADPQLLPPALGSDGPVTITYADAPAAPSRAILMLSPDGVIFYHKGKDGLLDETGTLVVADWAKAETDLAAPYMGAWIVPAGFDVAGFVCEGIPPPASLDGAPHVVVRRPEVLAVNGGAANGGPGGVTVTGGGGGGNATSGGNSTTGGGDGGGVAMPISAQTSKLATSGAESSVLNAWRDVTVALMVGAGVAAQLAATLWA